MAIATWILIAVYVAVTLFFVVRGALRTRSMQDYALGAIAFQPWAVALSLAASMTSAATFIINPGFVAVYGFPAFWGYAVFLPLAAFISLVVLSKRFRQHGQQYKALTLAQWMGARYQHKGMALFFALLSLLLITFIVLINVGLTKILAVSLSLPEPWVLGGVVVFVFGYMMFGGANSMVYTNMAQALIMVVVALVLLTSGWSHFEAGVNGFLEKLRGIDPKLVAFYNPESPLFRDFFEIVICQMVVGVAVVVQPHIITRAMLLRSDKDVNRYLTLGILVQALFFLVVFAGFFSRLTFPDLTNGGKVIGLDGMMSAYVVARFPVIVGVIVVLGLISAGISTLEGLIQSLSTTITSDILGRVFVWEKMPHGDRMQMRINRLVIVVLAGVSFVFSLRQLLYPNLSVGIFAQNGVYAFFSAAFAPMMYGLFIKNFSPAAAFAAALTAVLVHFATYYSGWMPYLTGPVRNPAVAATFAIFSALAMGMALHLTLPKRPSPTPNLERHG